MDHLGIPKFDAKNRVHQKLAELSRRLHDLKGRNQVTKLERLEKEVDDSVRKLFRV
jgi:hypothetical protein